MTPDDPRHGTNRGYRAHRVAGQTACDACKRAAADYQAALYKEKALRKPPRRVPTRGIQRRIEALYALGWTSRHIADAAGWTGAHGPTRVTNIICKQSVTQPTALAILRAYKALSDTPGPSELNRLRAQLEGWGTPAAWDDIDRDERPSGVRRRRIECGTAAGYRRHRKYDEEACRPCKDAEAAEYRNRRRRRAA